MSERTWEQVGALGQDVTDNDDAVTGEASWQGAEQAADAGQVSGETVEESLEAVVERVLSAKLGGLRQDLTGEIERRVQSFSDKTANRLSEEQRARLRVLDEVMGGLKDVLGPDYDAVRRQRQLDILLSDGEPETAGARGQRGGQQNAGGPTQAGPVGESDFANVYLSQRLGDPSEYSAEERQAIQRDLSNANGWGEWMAVAERYAGKRAGRISQTAVPQSPSRAARAQPVQGGRPSGQMTPEQLQAAYNKAATRGDMDEMNRVGALIDKLVE